MSYSQGLWLSNPQLRDLSLILRVVNSPRRFREKKSNVLALEDLETMIGILIICQTTGETNAEDCLLMMENLTRERFLERKSKLLIKFPNNQSKDHFSSQSKMGRSTKQLTMIMILMLLSLFKIKEIELLETLKVLPQEHPMMMIE